jgi:hypothetical protein
MDINFKIEETQLKLEDVSVKLEGRDWFSRLACKTEDTTLKFEDARDSNIGD